MERVSVEDILKVVDNKYEAIIIVAKEARRLSKLEKETEEKGEHKPPIVALENLVKGKIKIKKK